MSEYPFDFEGTKEQCSPAAYKCQLYSNIGVQALLTEYCSCGLEPGSAGSQSSYLPTVAHAFARFAGIPQAR